MMKLKYLYENIDLAKTALKHWEHDGKELDEMLSRFRISSNAIYPFYRQGKVCFLRLAPCGEKLEYNIAGELEFIGYLIGCGYPALKPVPSTTGLGYIKLSTEWGDYYASVFEKVDGVQIEQTDCSDKIMRQCGKTLGRLHLLSKDFVPEITKWTHSDVLAWINAVLDDYGADNRVYSELAAIAGEMAKLPQRRDNYGLIHYDFEPDNVFYDERSGECSVIDFDDGMYHWFALDVEQALGSLSDVLDGEALKTAQAQLIAGYASEYRYDGETEAMRPLMRRFIELYSYARLKRCVAEVFPDEPEWLIGLRAKLYGRIDQIEADIIARYR